MSDDQIEVREHTAVVLLGALCVSLGTAIGLVWGLDWRVFWTVLILAIGAVIVAGYFDTRRKQRAEAAAQAQLAQEWREAVAKSPFSAFLRAVGGVDPKGQDHPMGDRS